MNIDNFDAKGQVLFIEPTWVTGETCVGNINNIFSQAYAKSKLSKLRKDFILKLEKEGFIITYDKKYCNDEISLIMNNLAICDELADIKTFKKEFDKRMFEAGTDKLNYPYSLRIEEFFAKPFFPAVLKNELTNGGIDKFLIETPEQLEKIKKFYKKFHNIEPYKTNFENCIFQQWKRFNNILKHLQIIKHI